MTKATSHDLTVYELVTWILLRQACWRRSSKSINRKTPDKLASSRVSRNINKEGSLIAIKTSGGNFRVELQTAGVGGVKVRQRNCFFDLCTDEIDCVACVVGIRPHNPADGRIKWSIDRTK